MIKRHIQCTVGMLLLTGICAFGQTNTEPAEPTFETLTIGRQTFTNAVVQNQDETYIFIRHDGGLHNIRVADLPEDVRVQLGYAPPEPSNKEKLQGTVQELSDLTTQLKGGNRDEVFQQLQQKYKLNIDQAKLEQMGLPILIGSIAIVLFIHFFYSYCLKVICNKTETDTGLLVWIPVLQIIPGLRAAKMSGWLLLLMIVPVINLIISLVWAVKLCVARGKSGWMVLMMFIPLLNLFFLPYLAFSE